MDLRVLIVDDEPPARAKLRRLLAGEPELAVVGEATGGEEAVALVRSLRPDVMLLDVQMPGLDGFGVLGALEASERPQVIFVTAYDEYAIRAFEVHAVDYVLKPVEAVRLGAALARARERVRSGTDVSRQLAELVAGLAPRRYTERLLVQTETRALLLDVGEIDWIEAEQNYVRLHRGPETFTVRGTLAGLEARLDPARFVRIHRSRIVNLARVRELHPWSHGDMLVVLRDGTELMLSRRYRDRLERL